MPTITEVTPGDLITAELMNQILQRLAALEGKIVVPTGNITVPTLARQNHDIALCRRAERYSRSARQSGSGAVGRGESHHPGRHDHVEPHHPAAARGS